MQANNHQSEEGVEKNGNNNGTMNSAFHKAQDERPANESRSVRHLGFRSFGRTVVVSFDGRNVEGVLASENDVFQNFEPRHARSQASLQSS